MISRFPFRMDALVAFAVAFGLGCAGGMASAGGAIIVQSTTSTANSGLYDHLLPLFAARTDMRVNVVAVGTGQAIRNARNCDGDVLLVHAKGAEEEFVADGAGLWRQDLMYNDFVIVGPASDPAAIAGLSDVREALAQIADSGARFVSRGDDSGTHKKEKSMWQKLRLAPAAQPGVWYRETGSGMGATLNFAVQSDSYTLTDRATWLAFANKFRHRILFEGDPDLFNQYGIVTLSPDHCPSANHAAAARFTDWLLSPNGQELISSLKRRGEQLFVPNAAPGR